jgi:DNA-binding NtrC family response regulator
MDTDVVENDPGVTSRAARQRHVLMVDDDAVDRERAANYLALNDFRVTPAESGKRMMEILRDEPIDLVALETTLRGEDGQPYATATPSIGPVNSKHKSAAR